MRKISDLAVRSRGGIPHVSVGNSSRNRPHTSQMETKKSFRAYLDADWHRWLSEYPELATGVGERSFNRTWSDDSPEGIEARRTHLHESLAALKKIDRAALPASEQVNYDLYLDLLQSSEEGLQYGDDPMPFRQVVPGSVWMPLNQMGGIPQGAAETLASMPRETVADYEDILARLEALPKSFDQNLALLKDGLKRGYSQPKIIMRDVPKQIADLATTDPAKSALLDPFKQFPDSHSAIRTHTPEASRRTRSTQNPFSRPPRAITTTSQTPTFPPAATRLPPSRSPTVPQLTPFIFAGKPPRISRRNKSTKSASPK